MKRRAATHTGMLFLVVIFWTPLYQIITIIVNKQIIIFLVYIMTYWKGESTAVTSADPVGFLGPEFLDHNRSGKAQSNVELLSHN